MIVLSAQIKPLLERMRTAVAGFSQASAVGFVIYARAFTLAICGLAPVALLMAFVYSSVQSFLLVDWLAVVFVIIARAHLVGIARIVAVFVLVIAGAQLADWSAPVGAAGGLVEVDQWLLNTTVSADFAGQKISYRSLLLKLRDMLRAPSTLVVANARFATIAIPAPAAFVLMKLTQGLVGQAAGAGLVWYTGHVNLQSRLAVPTGVVSTAWVSVCSNYSIGKP